MKLCALKNKERETKKEYESFFLHDKTVFRNNMIMQKLSPTKEKKSHTGAICVAPSFYR